MYKRKKVKKLGRTTSHRKALIKNQLRSIMQSGKVRTSSVKAKVLKGELDSIFQKIRNTKEEDLILTRYLLKIFGDINLVKKVQEVGKISTSKITIKKIGYRVGDNTEMSIVEIAGFKSKVKPSIKTKASDEEKVEDVVEPKQDGEKKKGILNLGRKSISKKIEPIKKERARSRSGI